MPPLVSRRVLETLTYLAKNHAFVAKLLLSFRLPDQVLQESQSSDQRGKAVMVSQEAESEKNLLQGQVALALLLSLLNHPLYLRSIAHLEQVAGHTRASILFCLQIICYCCITLMHLSYCCSC